MPTELRSSSKQRLERFKRRLTLQLFLQEGPFWDAIAASRDRWSIEAQRCIPEEGAPIRPALLDRDVDPAMRPTQLALRATWRQEIEALQDTVIPRTYRDPTSRRSSQFRWFLFLGYCVLYDPPPMSLLEFASKGTVATVGYGVIDPKTIDLETWKAPSPAEDSLNMFDPPIAHLADPEDIQDIERSIQRGVLEELGRRYFDPHGLNIFDIVAEIVRDSGIAEQANRQYASLPLEPYVTVSPETTKDDVLGAFRLIADTQPDRGPGGRPTLDPLTAVQCAILKDQGWTNAEIAVHFNWPLRADAYDKRRRSNTVIAHLELGRKLLHGRNYPTG